MIRTLLHPEAELRDFKPCWIEDLLGFVLCCSKQLAPFISPLERKLAGLVCAKANIARTSHVAIGAKLVNASLIVCWRELAGLVLPRYRIVLERSSLHIGCCLWSRALGHGLGVCQSKQLAALYRRWSAGSRISHCITYLHVLYLALLLQFPSRF